MTAANTHVTAGEIADLARMQADPGFWKFPAQVWAMNAVHVLPRLAAEVEALRPCAITARNYCDAVMRGDDALAASLFRALVEALAEAGRPCSFSIAQAGTNGADEAAQPSDETPAASGETQVTSGETPPEPEVIEPAVPAGPRKRNFSPEARARLAANAKARMAALTPEAKAALLAKAYAGRAAWHAARKAAREAAAINPLATENGRAESAKAEAARPQHTAVAAESRRSFLARTIKRKGRRPAR